MSLCVYHFIIVMRVIPFLHLSALGDSNRQFWSVRQYEAEHHGTSLRDLPVICTCGRVLYFSNRQHALDNASEDDVLAVKEVCGSSGDEELAAVASTSASPTLGHVSRLIRPIRPGSSCSHIATGDTSCI